MTTTPRTTALTMALAAAAVSLAAPASAVVLVSEDFDDNLATDTFTLTNTAGTATTVIDQDPGLGFDGALEFTDNDAATFAVPRAVATLDTAQISTDGTGNNLVTGSFEFLLPQDDNDFTPRLQFLVNTGQDTAGVNNSFIIFEVFDFRMVIRSSNGSGGVTSELFDGVTAADTTYRVDFALDLSSDTQDTFDLSVTDTNTDSVVASVDDALTRVTNGVPDRIVLNAGLSQAGADAEPFLQLDNISAQAVPEPASLAIAVVGLALVTARRR